MSRPCCPRRIEKLPGVTYFKPTGVPSRVLEEVTMTLDELEALRLADLEGLYHEEAAARMKVSRSTFGRIIESARKKVADALANGRALRLGGGPVVSSRPMALAGRGRGWGRRRRGRRGAP